METTFFKNPWDDQSKLRILAVAAILLVIITCTQAYLLARRPYVPEPQKTTAAGSETKPLSAIPSLTVPDAVIMPDSQDVMVNLLNMQKAMDQWFAHQLQQQVGSTGGQGAVLTVPKIDLRDEKSRYIVRMDVPGADQASINVNIEGRILTISGKRELLADTTDGKLVRQERYTGLFERSMQLPGSVKAGEMEAAYDKGVLTVTLPKDNQSVSKTIKVK